MPLQGCALTPCGVIQRWQFCHRGIYAVYLSQAVSRLHAIANTMALSDMLRMSALPFFLQNYPPQSSSGSTLRTPSVTNLRTKKGTPCNRSCTVPLGELCYYTSLATNAGNSALSQLTVTTKSTSYLADISARPS